MDEYKVTVEKDNGGCFSWIVGIILLIIVAIVVSKYGG